MNVRLRFVSLAVVLLTLLIPVTAMSANRQTIEFPSQDGLTITADFYKQNTSSATLILMFHQARSSRGEYRQVAPRLVELGYNVLAVDLRSGAAINEVENETWKAAVKEGKATRYSDAFQDMQAALAYARKNLSSGKIIVWGSSYSASLSIVLAALNPESVAGVFAFSPGEYFGRMGKSESFVRDYAGMLTVPVFMTSARSESKDVRPIYEAIPAGMKELYTPMAEGQHGAKALWPDKAGNEGYWLAAREFLNSLKNTMIGSQATDAEKKHAS